jgi:hypothetical protein
MSLANPIPTSLRAITLAAALGALAFPAAAASVKVNITGLDSKAAHAQIVRAAATVCSAALADQPLRYYAIGACIDQAVATTEAKFAANDHRYAMLPANGR